LTAATRADSELADLTRCHSTWSRPTFQVMGDRSARGEDRVPGLSLLRQRDRIVELRTRR
jgi:hypothetical protein